MKFNVQRVLTPAYLTSVALIVVGVVLGLAWYPVAAWLFVLCGLALNAMAVSVTAINDTPRASAPVARRRLSLPVRGTRRAADGPAGREHDGPGRRPAVEPEAETEATPIVPSSGSSALKPRR